MPLGTGADAPCGALAHHHGVQSAFETQDHRRAVVSDASLIGVLAALGVPISGADQAPDLLADATADHRILEPVLVRRSGAVAVHRLILPAAIDPGRVRIAVRHEDGSLAHGPLRAIAAGPDRPIAGTARSSTASGWSAPWPPRRATTGSRWRAPALLPRRW